METQEQQAANILIDKAEIVAVALAKVEQQNDEKYTKFVADALRQVFNENVDSKKFIDVSRVPLICQNISGIHDILKEIKNDMVNKDQFEPVKKLVYGLVSLILTAVFGSLMFLLLK